MDAAVSSVYCAGATDRLALCIGYLTRSFNNGMEGFLPVYSREPIGSPELKRWFHCVMYPDGAICDQKEYEQVQAFDFT